MPIIPPQLPGGITPRQYLGLQCALNSIGDPEEAVICLVQAGINYTGAVIGSAIREFVNLLLGGAPMACANTHKVSTNAQGPGVCCAALSASGLTPAPGVRVAAVNSAGKCIVCQVKTSTSKKNPGRLVFVRGKAQVAGSTVNCPTTQEGCCALAAA
jgi:hypothetical protein